MLMAKTIIILLLIAGAAYFVYMRLEHPATEEDQLVDHLNARFAALVNKFTSAAGRAGLIGVETSFDIDTVVNQIKGLRTELAELRRKLTESRAIRKADQLTDKIARFCQKNEILGP
jgi:hypothetical protein